MKRSGFTQKPIKTMKRTELKARTPLKALKRPQGGTKVSKVGKVTKTAKKKLKTQAQLKKQLDQVFSIYIRQKYADDNGIVACYTCGKVQHWKQMQNGHFISRSYLATRFHEDNVRPQDIGCNIFGNGKPLDFEEHLKVDLGDEYVENLKKLRHTTVKYDRHWYLEQIEKFKLLIND